MLSADIKKKKKSDMMGMNPVKPSGVMGIESSKDLGEMKLRAIMDKMGSDRELQEVRDTAGEAKRITDKFKSSPDEALEESFSYPNKVEKIRKKYRSK